MMKTLLYFFIAVLPLMCSSNRETDTNSSAYDVASEDMVFDKAAAPNSTMIASPEAFEQKIIQTSYLRFETQNLDKTYQQIVRFVKQNNGFIQNDNSNKSGNQISRNLEIRIPIANFQKTIDSISSHVSFFDSKNISARDVTEEYIDLEARLNTKQTLEKRYLELLSKAANVKDMLEIERELSNIREEIESKQGRIKYLQDQVSLSTLNVEFYKITTETGVTLSYGSKMWNAIKSGFNGLSLFFLGLLHIWPFILISIVVFFLIKRWLSKKNKK